MLNIEGSISVTICHRHRYADVVSTLCMSFVRCRHCVYITRRCRFVLVDVYGTLCGALFGECIGYKKALLLVYRVVAN